MAIINNIQSDILENTGRFKFLTVSQIKRITGKSISYIRENLSALTQQGYIKAFHIEKYSKAENMYYLTEKGKDIIISHEKAFPEDIKLPVGTPLVVRDFQHRKNFIDIHIALYGYLQDKETDILKFYAYFDKTGNNRTAHNLESKTKIALDKEGTEFYMPDGIMITEHLHSQEKNMYLLEMYNGKDTIRTIQQIAKHGKAIKNGTPAKRFNIQKNPIILCVFEFESSKQAVIKRLQDNEKFNPISEFFFFASLDDVVNDCKNAWRNIQGEYEAF